MGPSTTSGWPRSGEAIADALARGHKVTFDFDSLTMVVRAALGELLALAEESTQP